MTFYTQMSVRQKALAHLEMFALFKAVFNYDKMIFMWLKIKYDCLSPMPYDGHKSKECFKISDES